MDGVTAEVLERIARKRRFAPKTLEIAKRLFLYHHPARGLSAEFGVNLARIYAIRNMVAQAARDERVPPGWEEVTLVAPRELVEEFRRRIAKAQAQQGETTIDAPEAPVNAPARASSWCSSSSHTCWRAAAAAGECARGGPKLSATSLNLSVAMTSVSRGCGSAPLPCL
jgi:hypothetical protein